MHSAARGRPRIQDTADDIVASILATAGPRVSSAEFSTRRVAELSGLSQTLVSRAFRRIRYPRNGAPETAETSEARVGIAPPASGARLGAADTVPLVLAEVQVRFPRVSLRFAEAEPSKGSIAGVAFERRATAVMAALRVSEASQWRIREESSVHTPTDPLLAVWDPRLNAREERGWEDFLSRTADLLSRCDPSTDAIPGELLELLARRAARGLHGTEWKRREPVPGLLQNGSNSDSEDVAVSSPPELERSPRNPWFSQVDLSVTEQIAIALRKEITNSGFRVGDGLAPQLLADRLGLSRTVVRRAMHRLVDDGLLDFEQGRFKVPAVTGADVVDLYAARLHLGMVLLRACAAQPRHRLLPARLALGAVEAAATQGTRSDVGLVDLQFQQELAEASGLNQSARGFHALTLRVRMFIAVLQLDYSPAVERIVSDDRRILTALLAGDAEAAVRAWRLKLDNAVRHMSALAPESFDAELWSRLSR